MRGIGCFDSTSVARHKRVTVGDYIGGAAVEKNFPVFHDAPYRSCLNDVLRLVSLLLIVTIEGATFRMGQEGAL